MFPNVILGIAGPLLGYLSMKLLGKSKLTKIQKILIYILSSLTFIFFVIFGLFDLSTELGPELDFGYFQISYGISESILNLLVLILPLLFGFWLIIALQRFNWVKRFVLPLVLMSLIFSINFMQTYYEYKQHQWDFEYRNYDCVGESCGADLQ